MPAIVGALSVLALLLSPALALSGTAHYHHKPTDHAHRAAALREVNSTGIDAPLVKRAEFPNARLTQFDAGLGNCGQYFGPEDYAVAINAPQWDNGAHCFKSVTISYQGKTINAKIMDQCVGCPYGALDLVAGPFRALVGHIDDQVYGEWSFSDGSDGGDKPTSTTKKDTPTPPPPPPPTSTTQSTTSTTSTTHSTTSSTTSSTSSSTSTTSSSSSTSTSSKTTSSSTSTTSKSTASSSATSTSASSSTASATSSSVIADVYQANLGLAELAFAMASKK